MRAYRLASGVLALLVAAAGCSRRPGTRAHGAAGEGPAAPDGAARADGRPATPDTTREPPSRRFVLLEGPVTLDGKAATTGDAVGPGASVVTAAGGRAVLALDGGSFVEVRPGTRVTIGTSLRKHVSLTLSAGALWSFVAPGSSYEVVTPNAVAVARGTRFFVEHGRGRTYVCACQGRVEVLAGGARALPRNLEAGSGHAGEVVERRGRAGRSLRAGRHDHSDAEEAALRAVVERLSAGAPRSGPPREP